MIPFAYNLDRSGTLGLEKLSEKGYGQHSECGFGCYTEHEKSLWIVCRAVLQVPPTLFGQFQKLDFGQSGSVANRIG